MQNKKNKSMHLVLLSSIMLCAIFTPISAPTELHHYSFIINTAEAQSVAPAANTLKECGPGYTTSTSVDEYSRPVSVYYYDKGILCEPNLQQKKASIDPSVDDGPSWFRTHVWNPLLSALGSLFLTFGASILKFAGYLFDFLIVKVIIGFGKTLETLGVISVINFAWGIFRDLSNILIIGMFVFIAICTILGIEKYGYKKLIANVLIIAVLMNFSLLFTKLIIDASNFTAFQFYSQLTANTNDNQCKGDVACAFLAPMGISSVWNTNAVTQQIGDTNGGMQALVFGFVGGVVLLTIAIVLLYGVVLMATRAVLIVLLMLTSSVAFATYLIPNFTESEYGWKGWWKALINCAIFAPLLMLFLSISLLILNTAKIDRNPSQNNLGGIISNPSSLTAGGSAWTVILVYLFTIGLLYASLKISSKFASMVSGVNVANALVGGVSGFAARNTIGLGASVIGGGLMKVAAKASNGETKGIRGAFNRVAASSLYSGAKIFKAGASNKALGDYDGAIKKRGKAFSQMAQDLSLKKNKLTPKDLEAGAVATVMKKQPHLAEEHKQSQEAVVHAEKGLKEATGSKISTETNQKAGVASVAIVKLEKDLAVKLASGTGEENELTDIQSKLTAKKAEYQTILSDQDQRIKVAREALVQANTAHEAVKARIVQVAKTTGILEEHGAGAVLDTKTGKLKNRTESEHANYLAHHRFTNVLSRWSGLSTVKNDAVAQAAGKDVDDHHTAEAQKAAAKALGLAKDGHDDHSNDAAKKPNTQSHPTTPETGAAVHPPAHVAPVAVDPHNH